MFATLSFNPKLQNKHVYEFIQCARTNLQLISKNPNTCLRNINTCAHFNRYIRVLAHLVLDISDRFRKTDGNRVKLIIMENYCGQLLQMKNFPPKSGGNQNYIFQYQQIPPKIVHRLKYNHILTYR